MAKKVNVRGIRLIVYPSNKKQTKNIIQQSMRLCILLINLFKDEECKVFTSDTDCLDDLVELDIDRFKRYRSHPSSAVAVDLGIPKDLYDHIDHARKSYGMSWQEILTVCQFLLSKYPNRIFVEKNEKIQQIMVD